jgi:hypothetical protein
MTEPISKDEGGKSEDKSPSLLMVRSENNQNPEKNVTSPPKKCIFNIS